MEEVSKCTACGELDSIRHTSDVGYCTECGTPENYEYVMVNEDGNEIDSNKKSPVVAGPEILTQ